MDAFSGVHLHRLMRVTFALNLNDQRIDSTDIIFDSYYAFAFRQTILKSRKVE